MKNRTAIEKKNKGKKRERKRSFKDRYSGREAEPQENGVIALLIPLTREGDCTQSSEGHARKLLSLWFAVLQTQWIESAPFRNQSSVS